jgi:hypothetical protein
VPFEYYGVHDGSDLTQVNWTRGTGYDVEGLTNVYTANDVWARLVIRQLADRVDNTRTMSAIGFCVSIAHARFMARVFNDHGIAAAAVWGDSPKVERAEALNRLRRREINILFSVDLFNEGVDLPNVETLLLLRPTESPVLFLQQLGRGLRKADGKTACLVLDFIGQHRSEFRFHTRLQALLGGSRKHVEKQVQTGFPFLPAGCHMELEPIAREIVLRSIRNAAPSTWKAMVSELAGLAKEGNGSLRDFLEQSGLEIDDVYSSRDRGWSSLKEEAGLPIEPAGPHEKALRRGCSRMLHVDDTARLTAYSELLTQVSPPLLLDPQARESRIARMLVASVCDKVITKDGSLAPESRAKVPAWQTGSRWLPEAGIDVAAFTLDKTSGQFSPTTRYRDYAISRELIHWESQGVVRADSERGIRYRNHVAQGSTMLLFARERTDDRSFWFLGPASYVRHEGERPMAITWKLEEPLPGDLFQTFAAAVG